MIRKRCLLVCLMVFICTEISAQDCSKFRRRLQEANRDNLKFLWRKMRPIIQCIENGNNFSPSDNMLRSINMSLEENVKVTIEEILQQTALIWQNYTQSARDANSMDILQKRLDEQIKDLKTCLNTEGQTVLRSPRQQQQFLLTRLRVKTHFQRIKAFLREEQYSQCALESVKMHLLQGFLWIDQLLPRIQ